MVRHLSALCCGILLTILFAGLGFTQVENAEDPAILLMRQAVNPQRDGSHLGLLFGLRQLHDPALQSFFHQLSQRNQPPLQVQAALALAEIDPQKKVDAGFIAQLDGAAQESIIASALDLELLKVEQLKTILKEERLQPMARLFVLAELVALKEPVDDQALRELAQSEDHHISGLASSLLAQIGDSRPFDQYQKHLASLTPELQEEVMGWIIEAIRRYELKACLPWVRHLVEDSRTAADLIPRCVLTLLELDPASGIESWNRALGDHPTYQQRVRFGLLLLVAGPEAPASMYQRIKGESGEDLIDAIVAMGHALSERRDPVPNMKSLIDLGHARSTEWAISHMKQLPAAQAEQIYVFLIDRIPNSKPEQVDSNALASQAVAKLFAINPALVFDRLNAAEDDGDRQQAILLGLLEVDSPSAGDAASKLRRIGAGRADSLALLLVTKHAKSLTPADIEQLRKIAAGGGRLSPALQVQAAWLYLKHAGHSEKALARIFAN